MFDIRIGTIIPADAAPAMMRELDKKGFESYELDFNGKLPRLFDGIESLAQEVLDAADGRPISALGYYGNPLLDSAFRENLKELIRKAKLFRCPVVSTFAGGDPSKSVPDTIPLFREVFSELCAIAENEGVKLALEGCGYGWYGGSTNIAYCPAAWDLIFEAVPSPALTLEWEPAHAVTRLMDPVAQLRKYAPRVSHIHGKDGTVDWDLIREKGLDGGVPLFHDRTPGFGDSNWADFFTILIRAGFEGSCDIEGYHDPVHYDDMEWTAQVTALDYLKRCRGGVEYYRGPEEYRGYQGKRK